MFFKIWKKDNLYEKSKKVKYNIYLGMYFPYLEYISAKKAPIYYFTLKFFRIFFSNFLKLSYAKECKHLAVLLTLTTY